jgi:hypothetical protein
MFILYAVAIGLVAGLALGGSLDRLAAVRFAWAPVAILGLIVQVALFSGPLGGAVGDAAPALYVASALAVLAAVVRNRRLTGLPLVAIGALSNLAAIAANGGYMPTDPNAVETAGFGPASGFSNSIVVADPALRPLTDIFALPAWLPFANVFSVGDVLIGAGIAVAIAAGMRRRPAPQEAPSRPLPPGNSPD